MLSNDKKTIVDQSWEEIKRQFSNGGRIIQGLKRVRDQIDSDRVSNAHFA